MVYELVLAIRYFESPVYSAKSLETLNTALVSGDYVDNIDKKNRQVNFKNAAIVTKAAFVKCGNRIVLSLNGKFCF